MLVLNFLHIGISCYIVVFRCHNSSEFARSAQVGWLAQKNSHFEASEYGHRPVITPRMRLQWHSHTLEQHSHTLERHSHTLEWHSHTLEQHSHTLEPHSHTLDRHSHTLDQIRCNDIFDN